MLEDKQPSIGAQDEESRASSPDAPNPQGRDGRGRFLPGNLAAVSHALRAIDLPPELRHLREEIAAYEAACLVDEGDDVTTRRLSLVTYRARVHRRVIQLDDALELRGLLDRRGRLRTNWLQQLATLINTAKALDTLLGLDRKPKQVFASSPAEAARAALESTR